VAALVGVAFREDSSLKVTMDLFVRDTGFAASGGGVAAGGGGRGGGKSGYRVDVEVRDDAYGLELLHQCTTHLMLTRGSVGEDVRDTAQIEIIREALLDILTETSFKRLCSTLSGVNDSLGSIRYTYSQAYWDSFLQYYHSKFASRV